MDNAREHVFWLHVKIHPRHMHTFLQTQYGELQYRRQAPAVVLLEGVDLLVLE